MPPSPFDLRDPDPREVRADLSRLMILATLGFAGFGLVQAVMMISENLG